ncbi:sensor histidine kinase [Bacillus sp. HMF5848]|uniref:sensor histidine kinase n=1 Tax=Bacillus sp. HMF5848 TaxID=2495421 RepID=UPI000F77DC7D|nr:sensor histidine kinase [Bacillus sp. HMF5848]RSK29110.1 sensor histidine kinase [Bacillus sp. HMF5848]
MKLIPEKYKYNGLFIIMFGVTFLMIIIVSVTITLTTIRMSEQFFLEKFSITNAKVINQIKDSLESFNYSIVLASNNLLQSGTIKGFLTEKETNAEKMLSIYNVSEQMKRIKSNLDAYKISAIITGQNGMIYSTNREYWPISDEDLKTSMITRKTLIEPKKLMYHYDYRPQLGNKSYIVASRALMVRISGHVYGSMYIAMEEREFRKLFSNYTSPGNDAFIVNKDGIIVSSSRDELIGRKDTQLLTYVDRIQDGSHNYIVDTFMDKDYIILAEYLPSFDMYLFNTIDKELAIGDLIDKKKIFFISMGVVFIALIIVFLATRRLTNSLSNLVRQIASTSKHDFHQYVSVTGTYETRKIGHAFNAMLDELHEYVDQLVLSQKQRRNAELAALQQQINPHFLYNTLTSIKFMVMQGSKEEANETINALISLLQNTLGHINETVTVEQEVENLKNYVLINQKRYGERVKVNYFVAPDCSDIHIPNLILQPFIENAFFHAFNRKQSGNINVFAWKEDKSLVCEVMDNGDGMELTDNSTLPASKRKQQRFTGIGIHNVNERIRLIYGDEYGVTIHSVLGEGTTVRITIPI